MKTKTLILAIATTAMCLPVMAQKRSSLWNDTFNAGVSYSTNVLNEKTIDYRGDTELRLPQIPVLWTVCDA